MQNTQNIGTKLESRRLMNYNQVNISNSYFAQTIDIDIYLKGNITKNLPNMPDYPVRSLENAISYIHLLKKHGVNSIVVRLGGSIQSQDNTVYSFDPLYIGTEQKYNELYTEEISAYQFLNDQEKALNKLRNHFPSHELEITADPFGIAPNKDGSWGIKNPKGTVDYDRTSELLSRIAQAYDKAKMDGILTLGRIKNEVEITKHTLSARNSNMKIKSFSQNIESRTAYIYLNELNSKRDTGQKILPGNLIEMNIRTLTDILEGTDTVVVKPIENLHAILMTTLFINDKDFLFKLLNSSSYKEVWQSKEDAASKIKYILNNIDEFHKKCQNTKVSTYTVSGSYYLHKLLEQEKGEFFTLNVLDELYKNVLSIGSERFDKIIDRNAFWYLNKAEVLNQY